MLYIEVKTGLFRKSKLKCAMHGMIENHHNQALGNLSINIYDDMNVCSLKTISCSETFCVIYLPELLSGS